MTKRLLDNNIVRLEGGDSVVQVTWQKKNGEIVERYLHLYSTFKIGECNAWGWRVINIKYYFKGKYYPYSEYYNLLNKIHKKEQNIALWRQKMASTYKSIYRLSFLLIFFRYFMEHIKNSVK